MYAYMQFNTKAQSKEPFFWLRKHVEPKSLSGGYFYANEHSESTDFSFFPLSSNDKPKQPIVQGIALSYTREGMSIVWYTC